MLSNNQGREIQDFNPTDYLTDRETATLDRVSHFAVASTNMAIEDSNLELCCIDLKKAGIILGTSTAANQSSYHGKWIKEGFNSIQYSDILKYKPETTVDYLALKYGLKGRAALFVNACAAGSYAIGEAFELIRRGKADLMLAGGSETMSQTVMCGFSNMKSLARDVCRPFDGKRDGLLISEGSAIVVLEFLEHALARGARVYGEAVGYGLSCDAHHMTAPDMSGQGASAGDEIRTAGRRLVD